MHQDALSQNNDHRLSVLGRILYPSDSPRFSFLISFQILCTLQFLVIEVNKSRDNHIIRNKTRNIWKNNVIVILLNIHYR